MRTSLYTILCTAVRFGAVLLGWTMVRKAWSFFDPVIDGAAEVDVVTSVAYVVAGFVVAFLLWLYPGLLARLAMRGSTDQVFESPIAAIDVQRIAFSLLGMYFVMSGLLDLVSVGLHSVWLSGMLGEDGLYFQRMRMVECAYYGVEIVIGLIVCLGAGGLASALHRLRYAGRTGQAAQEPTPPVA